MFKSVMLTNVVGNKKKYFKEKKDKTKKREI